MSLKFSNICVIFDNSLFSSEADFGLNRLSKAKKLVPQALNSLCSSSISCKYTVIVSKSGAPHTTTIGIRSMDEVVSTVQGIQPEHGKFPMVDCLSLASNICLPNSPTQNHIVVFSSSPLFSESSLTWSSVIDRMTTINANVTIISLCGEVHVLKSAAEKLGGTFLCYSDDDRFTIPVKTKESCSVTLLHCGMADIQNIGHSNLLDNDATFNHDEILKRCPKCLWAQSNLPLECSCCGLLVTLDINDVLSKPQLELGFAELVRSIESTCHCCQDHTDLRHYCTHCRIQICVSCFETLSQFWHICPQCDHN